MVKNIIIYNISNGIDVVDERPEAEMFYNSLLYMEERLERENRIKKRKKTLKIFWNMVFYVKRKEVINMLNFIEKRVEGVNDFIIELDNGVELFESDWNGEVYILKDKTGRERSYRPVEEPDVIDDDGEVLQWKIIGFEEV